MERTALHDVCTRMRQRKVRALASNALKEQVIGMWRGAGYAQSTIQRRLRDIQRVYRRLQKGERPSGFVRKLSFANISRIAQKDARSRAGDKKLCTRIIIASLRAWADALRTLGKPVPAWISEERPDLMDEYWSHTQRLRGIEQTIFKEHSRYITWFLDELKRNKVGLHAIALSDVDHFVSTLISKHKLTVTTAANACICIRHFLRFLYRTKRINTDLAPAVIGPTRRQMQKRPPARVSWAVLKNVLAAVDRTTPLGKRDFAIFLTAASYGWGTADVLSLRLDDIDWYGNKLSIVRPKTGVPIAVTLRPEVAHALATYIQTARPANARRREVFLRHYAPWDKVPDTNSIASNLRRYAKKADISLPPRYSMKVFRCAHIAQQLNSGVPPKVIAEVVGHSDTRSLSRYASIDMEQLRRCALSVPK